jgi:hypothetical protein
VSEATMQCQREGCTETVTWSGKGRKPRYHSDACKQEAYRNRKREQHNRRMREHRSKLYAVPIELKKANQFVALHHRHNNPVPLHRFSIGAVDETGLLRGVAIVNNPIVPQLMDGFTLEVLRVATDGCPNACSFLYGAARSATFALGYRKLISYTLQTESGASMRGAGWQKVAEVSSHKGRTHRPGRKQLEVYGQSKWRWETINPEYARNKARPTTIILPEQMQHHEDHLQLDLFEQI